LYRVIYEDDSIIVVDKSAGIATQPDKSGEASLLERLGDVRLIHRLDQRVSGLIVFAKTDEVAAKLSVGFQKREVVKKYRAVVGNKPNLDSGLLTHWLLKDARKNMARAYDTEVKNSQKAQLKYNLINSTQRYHLLEIELMTGRFHQIRCQLSAIGCPIVGDLKYGFKRSSPDGSIFLQSYKLAFRHPKTNDWKEFEIEMPEIWKKYGF
jgi:23S rRNA pseudouridine1911/1915/1917 synthase